MIMELAADVCLCCCVWHPQIRQALSALEAGNTFAFATGKAARQKEKELAAQFREGLKTGSSNVVETGGGATLKVCLAFLLMCALLCTCCGPRFVPWHHARICCIRPLSRVISTLFAFITTINLPGG